ASMVDALPPQVPPPAVRERLLAAVGGRFVAFTERVARLLDVSPARAGELLGSIDDPATPWEAGPADGVVVYPLEDQSGPRTQGATVAFVRIQPGVRFPRHRHVGEEHVILFQGIFVEESGRTVRAGDDAFMPGDTEHYLVAQEGLE